MVTIAVSVAMLLLLARFRFPEEPDQRPTDPAPAPLERLAARAAYDELASTIADLERRIAPRVLVVRVGSAGDARTVIAPRLMGDRAIALAELGAPLSSPEGQTIEVISRDVIRDLAVLRVPAADDATVSPRTGTPRPGPRYVVVVEATPQGPTLRPVYVGRLGAAQHAQTGTPLVTLAALQDPLPRGSAVFSLDGAFLGLVMESGNNTSLISAEFLRGAAEAAERSYTTAPAIGIEVQPLNEALARTTTAQQGVVVSDVDPRGPSAGALQPGDVILRLNGAGIGSVESFRRAEQTRDPAAPAVLSVMRDRTPRDVTVDAAPPASPDAATTSAGGHGVLGRNVPRLGIEVISVSRNTAASAAGLRRGDLIVSIGTQPAPGLAALDRAYAAVKPGEGLILAVHRDQRQHIVALEKR